MKAKIYNYLVMLLALFSVNLTQGQILISNTTPVTENFNSMNAGTTAPTGWRMGTTASPTWSGGTATLGAQSSGSSNPTTGATYNWGVTGGTERAIGVMTSGGFGSPNSVMAFYRNNNASAITQLTVSYNLEKYRTNTAAASVQFFYSTNGSTWTAISAGDIAAATIGTGANSYHFASPVTYSVSAFNITGLNIANGSDIYLRWNLNTTGSNSQGIGVDDVSVTAAFAAGSNPTKLAITSISPSSPTAGNTFDVVVQSQDGSSLPANVVANTGFTLSTNGVAGTIGGATTGTITAGSNSVTVTGVTLPSAGTAVTLTATRGSGDNLTAGTSAPFDVLAAASQLAFVSVPSSASVGVNLSSFTVEARRPDNSVDNTYTGNITVSKASGPGTLSGTAVVAAVAGVATFSTLQFDQAGAYTLDAVASGLSNATSTSITITQLPVTWNFTTAAPSAGTPFANLSVSNMTVVNSNGSPAMLSSSAASSGYTDASGNNNAGAATINGALSVANSTYFQFTLTPATGYYVALSGFSFGTRSTTTGASSYALRSSKDNYATDIATGSIATNSAWALKNPSFSTVYSGTGSAITYRLYGYGGSGAQSGTVVWRIDDVILTLDVQQCVTPSTSISAQTNVNCFGMLTGSATVSATGGPGYTYSWAPSGGTAATASGLGAGTYTCTVTNNAGGCTATQTVTIAQPASALSTSVSSQENVNCNGAATGSATVMASGGTPTYIYSWAPSGGSAAAAANLAAGTYTCTVTDANGCVTPQTVSITEPAIISTSVSAQTNLNCNGGSDGSATIMASGGTPGYLYSWAPSGGTTATASNLMAGTYTCTVTDANGCMVTQTVTITEPAALSVSAGNGTSMCTGSQVTLNATSNGGTGNVTYAWMPGNMSGASVNVNPSGSTTYTVTGTDANGCTHMATVMVTLNALPTVGASANPATVCSGDPSTLTATGADTYSWSTGATGAVVSVAPTSDATYTVTGTDMNGCMNTAAVSVSVIACSGTPGEALSFDGVNDHITGTNALLPQGVAGRSFTAWIKPSQVNTTQTIFSYGGAGANQSSTLSITGGNLYYSAGSNDISGTAVCAITPNVWTHVAVTVSNKSVKFYVNGSLKFTGTLGTSPATSGTNWSLSSSTTPFEGWMDEVSVWNMVITTQISNSMNRETASGQTGQIALYHFNQGFAGASNTTTTTLTDASASSATGSLSGFALSGSSSNWVAPGRSGKTQLKESFCGTTLSDMNTQLMANLVSNATNYQWEFTDQATSAVYTYTRGNNQPNFYLYMLPQLTYGKTYSVQVRVFTDGSWGTYGETCTISTVAAPLTKLQNAFCGASLSSLSTEIFCDGLINVSNYEWEFTDVATSTVYTYVRGNNQNNFYFYMLPQLGYAKTYDIRVRGFSGGSWGSFGTTCQLTTPAFPTTQLQSVCGTTIASRYTEMFTTSVYNASNYEYEFTNVNTNAVFTKLRGNNQTNFYLYMAPLAALNTTYNVRVRAIVAGTAGPYGSVCTITTPATNVRLASDEMAYDAEEEKVYEKNIGAADAPVLSFNVYPNPSTGIFNLETDVENASIEVYDALGQLILKQDVSGAMNTITLDESKKGMFYLRVMSNNKVVYTSKLVKE